MPVARGWAAATQGKGRGWAQTSDIFATTTLPAAIAVIIGSRVREKG